MYVLQDVDWTHPSAVIFGNEENGITEEALAAADGSVIIPTSGFAQSLNISVAAAVMLYSIQQQRIRNCGHHADMLLHETEVLTAIMMLRDQVNISLQHCLSDGTVHLNSFTILFQYTFCS